MGSNSKSGFMPLLVAIGIVSMLGMMSLTNSMSSGILNRKKIMQLNAMESFYAAELATWHGALRAKEGLLPTGRTPIVLDNAPYEDVSRLPASEVFDASPPPQVLRTISQLPLH